MKWAVCSAGSTKNCSRFPATQMPTDVDATRAHFPPSFSARATVSPETAAFSNERMDCMNRLLPNLILYSDLGEDSILVRLAEIIRDFKNGGSTEELTQRTYAQVKRLLDLSTVCGFDENLWQCYLTWILMTNDNSFTRTCERVG